MSIKFTKHLVVTNSSAFKISTIIRVLFDSGDNTCKFHLTNGHETGWIQCTKRDYEQVIQKMEEMEELVQGNGVNTRTVGSIS